MKSKKDMLYLGIIGVLIVALASTMIQTSEKIPPQIQEIREFYSLFSDDVVILNYASIDNFYQVNLSFNTKANQPSLQSIFITQDGKYISTQLMELDSAKKQILDQEEFAGCLLENEFFVFGVSGTVQTINQLNVIGSFANNVFIDCTSNLEFCTQAGIKVNPTLYYQNTTYEGIKPKNFIQNLTGC